MIYNFINVLYRNIFSIFIILLLLTTPSKGDDLMIDDFQFKAGDRWEFISDQVMGGISKGKIIFKTESNVSYIHLSGDVSTKNRGGFIQARKSLDPLPSNDIQGIKIRAKGNDTKYYLHLRTTGTILPWHYYQAEFEVKEKWVEINIPLTDFKKSGGLLRAKIKPKTLRSIGIVAYGRDHTANLSVSSLSFY